MAATIYPTVPVARPEAEPWRTDEHSIRVDEMFARQLDTEFSGRASRLQGWQGGEFEDGRLGSSRRSV